MMGDIGAYANYFVSLIFFLVGLHLLGIIPLPFKNADASGFKRKGLIASFVLGLIFGIALGPCTFAFMIPVLTVAFTSASTNLLYSILLLLSYGIGHCSVIVFAGTFTEIIQNYLNWDEKSKGSLITRKICGILVIIAEIYLLTI
jgi:cytochrome c-type biogenesis protein